MRRILAALKEMKEQRPEKYQTFWTEFGAVLKEGLVGFDEGHDKLLELVLAPSTDGAHADLARRRREADEGGAAGASTT